LDGLGRFDDVLVLIRHFLQVCLGEPMANEFPSAVKARFYRHFVGILRLALPASRSPPGPERRFACG
jgi:hypothetical protein